MKKNILTCIVCFIWAAVFIAEIDAEAQTNFFSVTVATNKKSYLLGEPVSVSFDIQYTGNQVIDVNHPLDYAGRPENYYEKIEIAPKSTGVFEHYITPDEAKDALKDRDAYGMLRFKPGQTAKRTYDLLQWILIPNRMGGEMIFPKSGEYWIRVSVMYKKAVYADRVAIMVEDPKSETDKAVWKLLGEHADRYLLCKDIEFKYIPEKDKVLALWKRVLAEYPESTYAPYIKRALHQYTDSITPKVSKPVEPTDEHPLVTKAAKELEAQRYDVRGFFRGIADLPSEVGRAFTDIEDDLGDGKITIAEADAKEAAWYKIMVPKYSKPLSPEKWQHRQKQYAEEDEAVRKKAAIPPSKEEMENFAREVERLQKEEDLKNSQAQCPVTSSTNNPAVPPSAPSTR